MDRILRFKMNKAYSLLIAVFSSFSAQFVIAEDTTSTTEGFEYAFQPLSWYPLDELTAQEKEGMPSFCAGKYRPIPLIPRSDEATLVEANESDVNKNGDALLIGDVEFSQLDQKIHSDQAIWSQKERTAEFMGNVTIINSELVMTGDYAKVNQNNQAAYVENGEYSIPMSHMRGTAERIDSTGPSLFSMTGSTLSPIHISEPTRPY